LLLRHQIQHFSHGRSSYAGARLQTFRLGDRAELLVEHLLSAFAFTTRVPRQEDVGIDFFCSLISKQEHLLKAGPFFAVQAKSSTDPIVYQKEHEIDWIISQENPLLLCVANRAALAMDRWKKGAVKVVEATDKAFFALEIAF
jgi:hypothetical protein